MSLVDAWQARSPALLSVGGDSAIELASAVVMLSRFRTSAAHETMRRAKVNILALPLGSRPLATPLRTRLTNSPALKRADR